MHFQQFLVAYFSATVAALPSGLKRRQSAGSSGLGGLPDSIGGGVGSIPSSFPTSLLGGLGSLTGGLPLPTGLASGSGSDASGLGGILGGSGSDTSGLGGILGGSGSDTSGLGGILGGSGTDTSGLSGLLGASSSGTGGLTSGYSVAASGSITENGLDDACQNVTLIFARGTSELGNMGSIVGPGLSTSVKSATGNHVAVQGVTYAADAAGIATEAIGSSGAGTQAMVKDVQSALSKCPDTQVVLSGYSQGAMLVHNTMSSLTSTQAASVKVVVTFGDPFVGEAPKNVPTGSFKSFCASSDPVCLAGASSSPSSGGTTSKSEAGHLGYGADVDTAATFIKGKVSV
ncbi:hypothetical protein VPNG_10128 [Cytospora leucostoma]|uniref:Cutinase n=1 Tax=Cytospora leucostoma TaxID=1230097 RepID=A0A423VED6_9PEZI|nr:hypothetical protein VPNG_10128 [Cytospora leucostoma]